MARDYETETLYWAMLDLHCWGEALVRKGRDDWWAKLFTNGRGNYPAYQLCTYGSRYEPAGWAEIDEADPPTPADRKGFSRAVESLEAAGLLVAIRRYGSRLSHLQPTPKGLQVALTRNPWVDPAAIRKAIETARWGTPEHLAAIDATTAEQAPTKPRAKKATPRKANK